jgi:two-component system cell cycle response regulator DivK
MASKALLVVDDEPRNIELIRMVLEETGLPVQFVGARDGLEALRLARDLAPALILMDLKMPALDGWEATRRLKANPATAAIPVIALTAQAMAGDRERALAAGCDGYLTKPIDIHQLVGLLERHLS